MLPVVLSGGLWCARPRRTLRTIYQNLGWAVSEVWLRLLETYGL